MAISTLFFIFLALMVFGIIAAFINMIVMARSFFKGNIIAHDGNGFSWKIILHFIFGIFYVVGGLGALITGIMWIVTFLKAA